MFASNATGTTIQVKNKAQYLHGTDPNPTQRYEEFPSPPSASQLFSTMKAVPSASTTS